MSRTRIKIIEPVEPLSAARQSQEIFREAGWPSADVSWLAPLCLDALPAVAADGADLDWLTTDNLKVLARSWKDSGGSRNRALLMVFVRLCGCGGADATLRKLAPPLGDFNVPPIPWGVSDSLRAQISTVYLAQHACFEDAIAETGWPGDFGGDIEIGRALAEYARYGPHPTTGTPEIVRLMVALIDGAALDLAKVVDADFLAAAGRRRVRTEPGNWRQRETRPWTQGGPVTSSPRALATWMNGLGPRALPLAYPLCERCADDACLTMLSVGVQDAVEQWLMSAGNHWTHVRAGGPALADASRPYVDELEQRCSQSQGDSSVHLRRTWMWFAWCTFGADPTGLDADRRERILRTANEDVAQLRKLFARATPKSDTARVHSQGESVTSQSGPPAPWDEFERDRDHFEVCASVLYELGGVWKGMKPLLLALRSLSAPAVAADLRYWNESGLPNRPEPWAVVPEAMISLFHAYVGREQAADPALVELRGNIATFCLERLVDRWSKQERDDATRAGRKRSNEDMMERSPEWRICLIRAFSSLGLNPEAKGHRTLHAAVQMDPDRDVREAAHEAYQRLRRGLELSADVSPRRAIMSALWWMRQAHLLELQARFPELEIQLDPNGAQRTRTKELTRTKEAERHNKPADARKM